MGNLSEYQSLRAEVETLYTNMIPSFPTETFVKAVRLMGLEQHGVLAFRSEDEPSVLFDFLVYEAVNGHVSGIERYLQNAANITARDRKLLAAMVGTPTSLYRTVATFPDKSLIAVQDVLHPEQPEIMLTDISMSHASIMDALLVMRMLRFPKVSMTSGIVMPFPRDLESFLLRKSKILQKKVPSSHEGVRGFVAYFQLYREFGIAMQYADVKKAGPSHRTHLWRTTQPMR